MSRSALARRERFGANAWDEEDEGLESQNQRLREQVAEVEGWYRLLQAEHASLQGQNSRYGREMTVLQGRLNRLEVENKELQDQLSHVARSGSDAEEPKTMSIRGIVQKSIQYKWAAAAALAIVTFAARDPWVSGLLGSAGTKVRETVGGRDRTDGASDGYVRYAAMIQAREQMDRARKDYNEREGQLKGDTLLEAQDHLRAVKTRYRQARLAFLPELARRCTSAGLPLPADAAEALRELKAESQD